MHALEILRDTALATGTIALLCGAGLVAAQTIHRQVDAAGHITYSDIAGEPAPASRRPGAAEVRHALDNETAISSRSAAAIDAEEAERRLARSKLQRAEGESPLAGEREPGGSRALNHRYWQRQEKLLRRVDEAQRRVDETRPARRERHRAAN